MPLSSISLTNFTVFDHIDLSFSEGINVFIGENGTGKTHLMKLLYAACCTTMNQRVNYEDKIARVFRPQDYRVARLSKRRSGDISTEATVVSEKRKLTIRFSRKTRRQEAEIRGGAEWVGLSDLHSVFIPAKEILTHAWNFEAAVDNNIIEFDDTYLDIVKAAKVGISPGRDSTQKSEYLKMLQKIIDGKVVFEEDRFFLVHQNAKTEFSLVAEGFRKLALLWLLIKNGTLEKGSVLFWDEPEANLNPACIPQIVRILLALQQNGVQIFIATHDYFFAKYLELYGNSTSQIMFHSLYRRDEAIACESNASFSLLENNVIMERFLELYNDEIDQVIP